ncbi:MAG: ABC transporter permease, partial [Phycisphaeraceae bacterium]
IDLSIGAVVALTGIVMMSLLQDPTMNPYVALVITLGVGVLVGLFHGVLIGYCKLQPFIVTLCGLMGYRGLAQLISGDKTLSLHSDFSGLREIAIGQAFEIPVPFIHSIYHRPGTTDAGFFAWVPLPIPMLILLVLAVLGAVFLNKTVPGRYLLAMGRNEEAARFSGINTKRMTLLEYVICSTLAAMGGILFALDVNTVQPSSHGNFYELYAIAAAVLGGCSLRGGVGSIAGVVIGTAVMRSLYNAINLLEYPTYWEYIIIGGVLLIGVMIDEIGRQIVNRIKTQRRKKMLATGSSG